MKGRLENLLKAKVGAGEKIGRSPPLIIIPIVYVGGVMRFIVAGGFKAATSLAELLKSKPNSPNGK